MQIKKIKSWLEAKAEEIAFEVLRHGHTFHLVPEPKNNPNDGLTIRFESNKGINPSAVKRLSDNAVFEQLQTVLYEDRKYRIDNFNGDCVHLDLCRTEKEEFKTVRVRINRVEQCENREGKNLR